MEQNYNPYELQKIIGVEFSDPDLLKTALTHSSFEGNATSYERMEFLGDRILGLIVAEFLYSNFPDECEGDLAKRFAALVDKNTLAEQAEKIGIADYIIFHGSESNDLSFMNEGILADVMEAIIASIYLDQGIDEVRKFVLKQWGDELYKLSEPPREPKTTLQEWSQGKGLGLPIYEITDKKGPDHAPTFEITLKINGYEPIIATGPSRKIAEKNAATLFLEKTSIEHFS